MYIYIYILPQNAMKWIHILTSSRDVFPVGVYRTCRLSRRAKARLTSRLLPSHLNRHDFFTRAGSSFIETDKRTSVQQFQTC